MKAFSHAVPSSVPRSGLKTVFAASAMSACSSATIAGCAAEISSCSVGSVKTLKRQPAVQSSVPVGYVELLG